ncbi:DUF3473 domain-containing protein [bacterium AH-315-F03]|nr:DUF3473 domain-containing protein [bacterium AH-315-F03]
MVDSHKAITKNVVTVDLEEWFVVEILADRIPKEEWGNLPARVEHTGYLLLEILEAKKTFATFFILGWVAERYPKLVRDIADAGHEIACHSFWHRRVDRLDQEEFRKDTLLAIEAIESASGTRPLGYRAPSWSINSENIWALDTLAELAFTYDSSVFPVKHDIYGDLHAPQRLVNLQVADNRTILEFPASTVRLFGKNLPIAGGGYLRHSPYWYSSLMIRRLNREGQPAVVYVHPWEFDMSQPRIDGMGLRDKFRQYSSISSFRMKFERLLDEFTFTTMADYIESTARRPIGFERG